MGSEVLLDAGAVSRCRRRVHLEHDPTMRATPLLPPSPAAEQRIADAETHRLAISRRLENGQNVTSDGWVTVSRDQPTVDRVRATEQALADGVPFIWGALFPVDRVGHRRGGVELLVRTEHGYLPVLIVRHRITDRGAGAPTTAMTDLDPTHQVPDPARKVRSQPRDQLRLVHLRKLLQSLGHAEKDRALGGVIGLDADVVVWHDLAAQTWPGGRSALSEYDVRFADRLAVASAAAFGGEPLAGPSRILECRHCPWWPTCEAELTRTRDVSLVVRGEDAVGLRTAGVSTVDKLAALNPADEPPMSWTAVTFADTVALARAWLADLTVVRRVEEIVVPRADVEVDVDMESFGESGAYLWGCLLTGVDIGLEPGYHAFATWDPLPTADEARSFAEFWAWLSDVRARTAAAGLTFRAYCYNAMAENRWLFGSVERFGDYAGVPPRAEIQSFVDSEQWVDLFRSVSDQFLCAQGKGLKVIAPVAGFTWRDPEAGGEASMSWYRHAVGMDGAPPDARQRERLLRYNEDDVLATRALRTWMSTRAQSDVPFMADL
jgi:predicted RecB family nuclease